MRRRDGDGGQYDVTVVRDVSSKRFDAFGEVERHQVFARDHASHVIASIDDDEMT